jgi:hypothetical protein
MAYTFISLQKVFITSLSLRTNNLGLIYQRQYNFHLRRSMHIYCDKIEYLIQCPSK